MSSIWIYLAIVIWFAFGALISWQARKRLGKGIAEYFLANRKIGSVIGAFTLSTTVYSAFMMIGLVGLVYKTGIGAFGFEIVFLVASLVLLAIFIPRFWIAGKKYGYVTPAELLGDRYQNRAIAVIVAIIFIVTLIPYTSVQLMGAGLLAETLSGGGIPYWLGSLILPIIAFIYAWWAGMRSVAWTDALQGTIMLVGSLALLGFIAIYLFPEGMFTTIAASFPEKLKFTWGFNMWLGLTLPWIFFMLLIPQVSQRFFILKDVKSIRGMIIGFGIFGLIYTVLVTIFGLAALHIVPGLEVADQAMPSLLSLVPTALALTIAISIFAASVSTINSIVLSLSSIVGRDIYRALSPTISENRELFWGKMLIPIMFLVAWGFAQLKLGMIGILSTMSSGGLMSILPALIGAFFWKRGTAAAVIASSIPSVIVIGWFYIAGLKPLGIWPPVWGLIISTVIYVVVSYLTRPPEKAGEFVDYTKNWQANAKALKE
ncbi:MAG: sodium:solute symporter family protein [Dehalococcoidia bacterium]|nr:MAG: sodium:solute symporter family protein [Dehalococcoidia bacterium]